MERPLSRVFITVGTTKFNKLVQAAHSSEVLEALASLGCTHLVVQTGCSIYEPSTTSESGDEMKATLPLIETYDYKESIDDDIASADLVISHAGAGTTLEVLRAKKPLIVVINDDLMNNHQTELADKLASEQYCLSCTPSTLVDALHSLDLGALKPFPPPNPRLFAEFVDEVLGFT